MPKVQMVALEGGHGKGSFGLNDNGASASLVGMNYAERDITVDLGRRVYAILRKEVELADTAIFGVGIENRMSCGEKVKFIQTVISERHYDPSKCVIVSLHTNAGGGHGSEFWVPTKTTAGTKLLANKFVESFNSYGDYPTRTPAIKPSSQDRWGKLYIDDIAGVTWVLVEGFFIDNPSDLAHYLTNKDRIAEQIAHAILEYIRS